MAQLLLKTIEFDYVDASKPDNYYRMVSLIANSLGMDASDVYHSHPMLPRPEDEEEDDVTNFYLLHQKR